MLIVSAKDLLYDAIMHLYNLNIDTFDGDAMDQADLDACTLMKEKYDVLVELEKRTI